MMEFYVRLRCLCVSTWSSRSLVADGGMDRCSSPLKFPKDIIVSMFIPKPYTLNQQVVGWEVPDVPLFRSADLHIDAAARVQAGQARVSQKSASYSLSSLTIPTQLRYSMPQSPFSVVQVHALKVLRSFPMVSSTASKSKNAMRHLC